MLEKDPLFDADNNQSDAAVTKVNTLHLAAQNNDLTALISVLQQTTNINSTTDDGWTALHFAAFKGHDKIVDALIKAKINLNIQGKVYQRTALHYAADRGNLGVVKLLVAGGADVKILDSTGKTAANLAKEKGFAEIAKILGA